MEFRRLVNPHGAVYRGRQPEPVHAAARSHRRLRLPSQSRIEPQDQWPLLTALAAHDEDIEVRNLRLMLWYVTEGTVAADPLRDVALLKATRQPRLHQFIARRVISAVRDDEAAGEPATNMLAKALAEADPANRARILRGILIRPKVGRCR